MNNLCITGFMSSGKTVVSSELARLTGRTMLDTDSMIENKLKMKITDIFANFGEDYFRKEESLILIEALKYDNAIISTGGGIILSDVNIQNMKNNGIIISLIPDFSVIESRLAIARATRPLLMEETEKIKKRFYDRLPQYKKCDIEINPGINDTPEMIARNILERIG